jgi:cytoskeleton protein RodZ
MSDSEQPAPTETAPASLGEMLRSARVAHDLTIEQVSTELRIEAKQLKALEDNRFAEIGVPVFIKGYLRQYGQRLGLDVRDLLAAYYRQTDLSDVQVQPSRVIRLRDTRQITRWLLAAIVLVTVAVGLAVWWWSGGEIPAPLRSPGPSAGSPTESPAASEPSRDAAPAAAQAAPAGGAEPVAAATPAAAPDSAREAAEGEAESPPANPLPLGQTIPLEFTFDSESWTEVTDASGERLLFGLSAAGRQVTVRGVPPVQIVLGNANAVRLVVDGEEYPIPTRGRQGELARFSVDVAEE